MTDEFVYPVIEDELENLKEQLHIIYTKHDLVEMVAAVMMRGDLPKPLLPPREVWPGVSGRPPKEISDMRRDRLIGLIKDSYPHIVDMRWLATYSNMAYKTVRRLQKNFEFFMELGPPYADYFRDLPPNLQTRLSPTWRAILDIHNYLEALKNPGIRLPIYQTHAIIRTPSDIKTVIGTSKMTRRNRDELYRLKDPKLVDLMVKAGYGKVTDFVDDYDEAREHLDFACTNYCPVLHAYWDKSNIYLTQTVRDILGLDNIPMVKLPLYIKTGVSSLEIVKQILGVK